MNITRNITDLPVVQSEISDNDIVSDDHQARLIYWRDVLRMGQFDIGDIATEEIKRNAQNSRQITEERIFRAIGHFCGKTERTVRYYYETAVFYTPEIRQEFNILPFSHFVEARGFGNQWREFLERSMLYPGRGVASIRNQMVAAHNSAPVAADFSGKDSPDLAGNQESHPGANQENSEDYDDDQADKKTCEASHGIPERAIAHDRLSIVNAIVARLPELNNIVRELHNENKIDPITARVAQEAIAGLVSTLPEISRNLV